MQRGPRPSRSPRSEALPLPSNDGHTVTQAPPPAPPQGLMRIWCDQKPPQLHKGRLIFFYYVNYLTKYYELLDTALLVLRGRPVAVFHMYHHAWWVVSPEPSSPAFAELAMRWGGLREAGVRSRLLRAGLRDHTRGCCGEGGKGALQRARVLFQGAGAASTRSGDRLERPAARRSR